MVGRLALISRHQPHRLCFVQKGFWANSGSEVKEMLDDLEVGPRYLANSLETSRFEDKPKPQKVGRS